MQGQRIIIVGDSTMRQVFQSLACILHEDVEDGYLVVRSPHLPHISLCNSFIVAAKCNLRSSSHWPACSMTMIGRATRLLRHPHDVTHGHLMVTGSHRSLLSII
jgi:hypothetical protein